MTLSGGKRGIYSFSNVVSYNGLFISENDNHTHPGRSEATGWVRYSQVSPPPQRARRPAIFTDNGLIEEGLAGTRYSGCFVTSLFHPHFAPSLLSWEQELPGRTDSDHPAFSSVPTSDLHCPVNLTVWLFICIKWLKCNTSWDQGHLLRFKDTQDWKNHNKTEQQQKKQPKETKNPRGLARMLLQDQKPFSQSGGSSSHSNHCAPGGTRALDFPTQILCTQKSCYKRSDFWRSVVWNVWWMPWDYVFIKVLLREKDSLVDRHTTLREKHQIQFKLSLPAIGHMLNLSLLREKTVVKTQLLSVD